MLAFQNIVQTQGRHKIIQFQIRKLSLRQWQTVILIPTLWDMTLVTNPTKFQPCCMFLKINNDAKYTDNSAPTQLLATHIQTAGSLNSVPGNHGFYFILEDKLKNQLVISEHLRLKSQNYTAKALSSVISFKTTSRFTTRYANDCVRNDT